MPHVKLDKTVQEDDIPMAWKIDDRPERKSIWQSSPDSRVEGAMSVGQPAFDFALEIMRAKNRVEARTPTGTLEYDVTGSKNAIQQLFTYCKLDKSG